MKVVLTGKPDCAFCKLLERIVSRLSVDFEKIDITDNPEYMAKVKEGGNTMPACIFVGDNRYVVSADTPAKVPQVQAWMKEQGVL